MIGPVLRAFGAAAQYDPATGRLTVSLPLRSAVGSPTPFNPAVPRAAPSAVFTPARAGDAEADMERLAASSPNAASAAPGGSYLAGTRALTTGTIHTA